MSDNFVMLADVDATLDEGPELSQRILAKFRERELITGPPTKDCVLGGIGYRPGPKISDLYQSQERRLPFWELTTCGVEVRVERSLNFFAMVESCKGFACPACNVEFDAENSQVANGLVNGIEKWLTGDPATAMIPCPNCNKDSHVTKWHCKPPLAFSNLAVVFWNWPHLDAKGWRIDLVDLVRCLTKHTIVYTYGRI